MYKAYKFRMYPTKTQQILIAKTLGCVRFIYNYFLDKCKKAKYIKAFDMCKELKEMYNEYPFLKEVDSCSLRCAIFNLEDAYKDFFAKRNNYPVFKNKYAKQSYRTNCIRNSYKENSYSNIELNLKTKEIKLPKLGKVKIRGYRNLKEISEKIINATITKETTGKYYVSVLVEEENKKVTKIKPTSIVGIDLGIKTLVVTSNGEEFGNPKYLSKYERRIKKQNRKIWNYRLFSGDKRLPQLIRTKYFTIKKTIKNILIKLWYNNKVMLK